MSPLMVVNESVLPSKPTVKSEITPNRSGSVPVGVLNTLGARMSGVWTFSTSLDLQPRAARERRSAATARARATATRRETRWFDGIESWSSPQKERLRRSVK